MEILFDYLLISLFFTLMILYFIHPEPKIILVKPNVNENYSNTYVDKNNVCYKYKTKKVNCDKI